MKNLPKNIIKPIVIILAIIVGIMLMRKIYLWVSGTIAAGKHSTAIDGKTITITQQQAKGYINRVFNDCQWFKSDSAVYNEMAALTDGNLAYVCNVFAQNYTSVNDGDSLPQYIENNRISLSDSEKQLVNRMYTLTNS